VHHAEAGKSRQKSLERKLSANHRDD